MKRLVLITILLTGCASGVANQNLQTNSSPVVDNQKDLEHKVLCAKYVEAAKAALSKDDKQGSMPDRGINQMTTFLKMFFSTTRNSCLYTWDKTTFLGKTDQTDEFGVSDALTGEDLHFENSTGNGHDRFRAEQDLEDFLKQYQ